jgi:hypothetical protein
MTEDDDTKTEVTKLVAGCMALVTYVGICLYVFRLVLEYRPQDYLTAVVVSYIVYVILSTHYAVNSDEF